jgi:SWI/SNF chromatin-remodeling complex subunit SWI1
MPTGQRPTSAILASYYNAIIQPFEEAYRRDVQDTNRKAMMSTGRPPGPPVVPNNPPNIPSQTPGSAFPGSSSQLSGPVNNMMGLLNQSVSGGQSTSVSITGSPAAPASQTLPQSPHPQHGMPNTSLSGTHGFSESLAGHSLIPPLSSTTIGSLPSSASNEHHEQDAPGTKRRFESEELDGKRTKLKIGEVNLMMFDVRIW